MLSIDLSLGKQNSVQVDKRNSVLIVKFGNDTYTCGRAHLLTWQVYKHKSYPSNRISSTTVIIITTI